MNAAQSSGPHYCHNCKVHGPRRDGVYCGWCLDFLAEFGRWPVYGDRMPTPIERLYARLGWR